ncbi:MAG: flagellar basal body rod protein FlgC [Rhodospirillales bacterium]|nr:flagellar basal body rod protein FlgC [Rhodospirillales bacterium]
MDDIASTLKISAAGMRAQGVRLKVIAENIANADSLPAQAGDIPYRRQVVSFRNELDRATGVDMVRVRDITADQTPFPRRFDPNHPAADTRGYVEEPNVNALIEIADMREAERSYDANLRVIQASKGMLQEIIDVLR